MSNIFLKWCMVIKMEDFILTDMNPRLTITPIQIDSVFPYTKMGADFNNLKSGIHESFNSIPISRVMKLFRVQYFFIYDLIFFICHSLQLWRDRQNESMIQNVWYFESNLKYTYYIFTLWGRVVITYLIS